jgi:serine/threonine protein kinase
MTYVEIKGEVTAAKKLSSSGHTNIVKVLKSGNLPPWIFIDMELCDLTLERYILRGYPAGFAESMPTLAPGLSILRMWKILKDICNGVAFIHEQGMVHRDLKPRNGKSMSNLSDLFIVLYSCQNRAWKLADFGLTMEVSSKGITTQHSRGTPCYRAPELLLVNDIGTIKINNKVDIWAIGCIQYELVFHKKAFVDDYAVLDYRQKHEIFKKRFKVPKTSAMMDDWNNTSFLSDAIPQMLEVDEALRPTAKELSETFSNLLDSTNNSGEAQFTNEFTMSPRVGRTGTSRLESADI